MQYLNSSKDPKVSRGMLFGKTEFWLAIVSGTEFCYRMKGKWNDRGAGAAIKNFFAVLPWDSVASICNQLNAQFPEPTRRPRVLFWGPVPMAECYG